MYLFKGKCYRCVDVLQVFFCVLSVLWCYTCYRYGVLVVTGVSDVTVV